MLTLVKYVQHPLELFDRNDALGEQHGAAVGGQDDARQVVLSRGQEGKTLHVSGALMRVTFVNVYCINIGNANEWILFAPHTYYCPEGIS